jgi:hypothetical protein
MSQNSIFAIKFDRIKLEKKSKMIWNQQNETNRMTYSVTNDFYILITIGQRTLLFYRVSTFTDCLIA